jgi:hypothetical protein
VINAGVRIEMLVDSLAASFEAFASSNIHQEAIDIVEPSSQMGFVRLPIDEVADSENYHFESLLVDLEDERRWIEAIFAEHGV